MKDRPSEHYWYVFICFNAIGVRAYEYVRNIDGWMMLEIQILMWQLGRVRFDLD